MNHKIVALAAVAHPDDIEFMMAGTLLLLKQQGVEIHLWNLCNGSCGSASLSAQEIAAIRWEEAQNAAKVAGGIAHPPLFDDLGAYYDAPSLARVGSVIREINPNIILTHSPQDYMEDHQNVCRLIVTAAFSRGMKNFTTHPPQEPSSTEVALYHALPHGLNDSLRTPIQPHFLINIASVIEQKKEMLVQHKSQKEWLDITQGMSAYELEMERMSQAVGKISGSFSVAEGWRRHSHLGFASETYNPLQTLLKENYASTPQ